MADSSEISISELLAEFRDMIHQPDFTTVNLEDYLIRYHDRLLDNPQLLDLILYQLIHRNGVNIVDFELLRRYHPILDLPLEHISPITLNARNTIELPHNTLLWLLLVEDYPQKSYKLPLVFNLTPTSELPRLICSLFKYLIEAIQSVDLPMIRSILDLRYLSGVSQNECPDLGPSDEITLKYQSPLEVALQLPQQEQQIPVISLLLNPNYFHTRDVRQLIELSEALDQLVELAKVSPQIESILTRLAYQYPEIPFIRYPRTGRPLTQMLFTSAISNPSITSGPSIASTSATTPKPLISSSHVTSQTGPIFHKLECELGNYLPIVRYEGIYYSEIPQSANFGNNTQPSGYCGTFYYYEPDSSRSLYLGNVLMTANKYHAIRLLWDLNQKELQRDHYQIYQSYLLAIVERLTTFLVSFLGRVPGSNQIKQRIIEYLAPHLLSESESDSESGSGPRPKSIHLNDHQIQLIDLTDRLDQFFTTVINDPQEGSQFIQFRSPYRNQIISINSYLISPGNGDQEYQGNRIFAILDDLDQIICQLAHRTGYSTVILQREPGQYRVVTEILDSRSRRESYNSICEPPLIVREQFIDRLDSVTFRSNPNTPMTVWYNSIGFQILDRTKLKLIRSD